MQGHDEITGWFRGSVPSGWFTSPVEVRGDRDEILVVGELARPDLGEGLSEDARRVALAARIRSFREETREARIRVARQVEHRYQRKVAWGARCGETSELFTHLSAPVMTRLRQPERQVLDTLVDAGVARSRSDALAWSVRLVGQHADEWLAQLREAMSEVDKLRQDGPGV